MKEFIEDFINVKIKMLEPKNLQFQIAPIPDELKIFWDPKLLKTCFDSIIENAVKFSPENGNIFIRYYEEDSRITFEICDEGTGFSEHAFQRLFTMFMPGEPHVDQNTGLQLTLVKLIMDAQSGKLEVTNRKEGGACIKLIF